MQRHKALLSTALLSDVLDELGYKHQLLPIEIKPNYVGAKIFGRARTMSLKKIGKGETYKDVYKGLYFLESLNKGDIFVVANAFPNLAFFGELMSTLAVRKGIAGTIVDGCTRDSAETIMMKYPVFSRINYARDIKKRGIVDKLDVPATVGEVRIEKGNLIFGDYDGVIVIPPAIEKEAIQKSIKVADSELKIKRMISNGASVDKILRDCGEF